MEGKDYLEIILNDKIFVQRTPNSKFIEFNLEGLKQNSYDELPIEIKKIVDTVKDMEENPDDYFKYTKVDGGIKITKLYDTVGSHVKIPEFIDGKPVIELGTYIIPYALQDEIKQIQLPETIEELGEGCFESGKSLRFLNLPKKVTVLPDNCFKNCSLTYIDFSNIKKIGNNACRDCWTLRSADLSNVTELGEYVFTQCQNLKNVKLSPDLKELKLGVFRRCNALEKIELPENLESLNGETFEDCFALKEINFPTKLKFIGDYCFYRCSSLKTFTAPDLLLHIGENAFNKSGLENIILNQNLKKVLTGAFCRCEKLKSVLLYHPTAFFMKPFDFGDISKIKVKTNLGNLIGVSVPTKSEER